MIDTLCYAIYNIYKYWYNYFYIDIKIIFIFIVKNLNQIILNYKFPLFFRFRD